MGIQQVKTFVARDVAEEHKKAAASQYRCAAGHALFAVYRLWQHYDGTRELLHPLVTIPPGDDRILINTNCDDCTLVYFETLRQAYERAGRKAALSDVLRTAIVWQAKAEGNIPNDY